VVYFLLVIFFKEKVLKIKLIKHKANPNIGEFSSKWPPLQICSLGEDKNKHLGVLKALLGL
jgi:hypothetical protein